MDFNPFKKKKKTRESILRLIKEMKKKDEKVIHGSRVSTNKCRRKN